MTPDELDLIETDALVEALERRSKASVVLLLRETGPDASMFSYRSGGFYTAVGMLTDYRADLIRDHNRQNPSTPRERP